MITTYLSINAMSSRARPRSQEPNHALRQSNFGGRIEPMVVIARLSRCGKIGRTSLSYFEAVESVIRQAVVLYSVIRGKFMDQTLKSKDP
jgi:hypothetical protein